jgi:hypothetical protein
LRGAVAAGEASEVGLVVHGEAPHAAVHGWDPVL